jgi:hypothetical protein
MRKTTNTVNTASKDILAKAMAMEGISVQHSVSAETAYFDTKARVLVLPVWEDMTNDIYDMLVGHEVSHALHTPAEGWSDFVGTDKFSGMRHQFLNVVEDARIERLIKDKFPGIRRNFASAYKQFADRDMFEIEGKDLATLPLLDRLNIEFKLGLYGHADVEFSADEQQYVERMRTTKTMDEVVALSSDLFEMWLEEQPLEEDEDGQHQMESGSGDDTGESQDGSQSGSDSESDEQDDMNGSTDASGDTDGDGDEDGEGNEDSGSVNRGEGEDSGESMEDNTDDGEGADSEQSDSSDSGASQGGMDYDDYSNDPCGQTQRAFDQGVKDMRNQEETSEYKYHKLPEFKLENVIVDYPEIDRQFVEFNAGNSDRISQNHKQEECLIKCDEFLNKSRPVVNHMVQQFMMKQAAEAEKKTQISKTGILDTVSMINYRWSEDIFVKNETHEDGKSHGLVMFLDWSGSMSDILEDTVEQMLVLTEFCNKMQIPFEVYAFTSAYGRNEDKQQYVKSEDDSVLRPHNFHLLNFLSSRMNKREYKQAVRNLWLLGASNSYQSEYRYVRTPRQFSTGCTPLNEAIVAGLEIIPAFQRQNDVQIVNTVILSDGDGHSMGACGYYNGDNSFIVEPNSRRNHRVDSDDKSETATYLQILKNQTGCNIIGIKLFGRPRIDGMRYRYFMTDGVVDEKGLTKAAGLWKTQNFFSLKGERAEGCDELFVVQGSLKVQTDVLGQLGDDASLAKVRNAFIKGNSRKKSSRVIASKIVDLIAV